MKTLVSKHLEQKHPTSEDIISIKRKTLESSKQVGAENVTLSEEMNEFIYLKKQKMNESKSFFNFYSLANIQNICMFDVS